MTSGRIFGRTRAALATAALTLLAGCVAPREAAPPPRPAPRPAPVSLPPAPPPSADWRDWPLTPGTWSYAPEGGGSAARYGERGAPVFAIRCAQATGTITLSREGFAGGEGALIDITTSAGRQSFRGTTGMGIVAVSLTARDPFLDKMAFSRGRFVVSVGGTARLVVPAWPEFARVIEDCRG